MKVLYILMINLVFLSCDTEIKESQEKTDMDRLCECFEANNEYTAKLNIEQDSIKRNKILTANTVRLETCRKLGTAIGEALKDMDESERKKTQESFQNSCSAYKEFIENNN